MKWIIIAFAVFQSFGMLCAETAEQTEPATEGLSPAALDLASKGAAAFSEGNFKAATEHYSAMLEAAPGHPVALVNLGTAKYRLGELDEALLLLRQAAESQPYSSQIWLTLGMVQLEQQRIDSAIASLARAVELSPADPRIHAYFGIAMREKGWMDGAEYSIRRAVDLDPEFGDAHFNLALIYLERQPPAKELARRHYQLALKLGAAPDDSVVERIGPPEAESVTEASAVSNDEVVTP